MKGIPLVKNVTYKVKVIRMNYLFISIIGFILGVFINTYVYFKDENVSLKQFYINFFKDIKKISLIIISIICLCLIFREYNYNLKFWNYSVLIIFLIAAAGVDYKSKIIPNKLIMTVSFIGFILIFLNKDITVLQSLSGAVICGGIVLIASILSKEAIGMGDVKLFACIGLFIGVENGLCSLIYSVMLSGIIGAILLIKNRENKSKEIAFAPFALMGTLITILV